MLLQQGTALTLGHATPNSELDPIIECISSALSHHGAMPANNRGLALRSTPNEQFVGIGLSA